MQFYDFYDKNDFRDFRDFYDKNDKNDFRDFGDKNDFYDQKDFFIALANTLQVLTGYLHPILPLTTIIFFTKLVKTKYESNIKKDDRNIL